MNPSGFKNARVWCVGADVDTDVLAPGAYMKHGLEVIGQHCLEAVRADFASGGRKGDVLVAGANFGCGSSREAAVYVMWDYGIRSVIAPSFGDIHYGNELQNGMLPVILPDATCQKLRQQLRDQPGAQIGIDLESQTVTGPDGATYHFEIDATHKERLLKGLDDIGLVMQNIREIEAFEKKHHQALPWLA